MIKAVTITLFILFSIISHAKDKKPIEKSKLSSSDIKKLIKSERKVLHGNHKVDIPLHFKEKSSTFAKRYGNTKKVLNLNEISLSGMDLRGTIFTMSDMIKTDLSKSDLTNSDLIYVDLTGADLTYSNLTKADLSNAVFEGTKLKGAIFEGANLFNAQFKKITDLTPNELSELKKRTNSYINLEREPLPDYYNYED